ncbi:MAG: AI-2E family transporter [Desulfobulbaceae bacterium DB1]|nr:MAG: AI-2E family transporter [Desulfobulbaceae bacterium DB1]
MSPKTASKIALLLCLFSISAIFLAMTRQFLMAIFMAGIFAALTTPLYRRLLVPCRGKRALASLLTIMVVACLFLLPFTGLIGVVVAQAINVSESVTPWVQAFLKQPSALSDYQDKIPYHELLLPYRDVIIEKLGILVGNASTLLIDSLSSMTMMTVNAALTSIIMLYTMFYFLIDGHKLLDRILFYLPLEDREERLLLQRFTSVAKATIKGTLIIGIIQGALCGIGFALAGIQSPVFWGTLMAFLSIIPSVGTAIIWLPALIILVLLGDIPGAVVLGIVCGGIAGNADNLLRPRLVGSDTQMHDLFVLFGTLGGISMFGLIGIMVGPILAALFVTIWEIYGESFREFLPEVGPSRRHSEETFPAKGESSPPDCAGDGEKK